jgi:hypothetical protein
MTDQPTTSDGNDRVDAGAGPGRDPTTAYPGTPRWVIVLVGLVLLVVVVLVVTSALGLHTLGGPGGHVPPIKH